VVVANPSGKTDALLVGVFTERAEKQARETVRDLVLVSLASLALAGLASWVVAGRILRPVRLVRQTAAEISEQDLTRRIPVEGSDEISGMAATFNAMLDRLEDAFAAQRRFVDDAGHELRTPITVVRGHLELMGDDPVEREQTIALVTQELDRMARIVTDLLALAKADRPDFVRLGEPVDMAQLTLDLDAKVQRLAERHWRLSHVADGSAVVDAERITQAVLQLAHNAVQHTRTGDAITLMSRFVDDPEQGRLLQLAITDTGPGVAPADRERIFERFSHGTPPAHRRRAGPAHRPGDRGGPRRPRPGGQPTGPGRHLHPGHPRPPPQGERVSTILIAEDTASIAAFVEKGLRAAGYQNATTGDGQSALLLAASGGFDLMILDIGLPGMDGFEVLRELRQRGSSMPVVILSARDSVNDTVHGLEGGANDYVTKPFQFAELLARVRLRLAEPGNRPAASPDLVVGDLRLDLRTRRVVVDGSEPIDLTSREFQLLEVFCNHAGQVLSREQLLGMVWDMDFDPSSNVVDVFVRSLRGKIGGQRIETVRGMGYRLAGG